MRVLIDGPKKNYTALVLTRTCVLALMKVYGRPAPLSTLYDCSPLAPNEELKLSGAVVYVCVVVGGSN